MKYLELFENYQNREFNEKIILNFLKEKSPNSIVNEKFVMLYHGTNMKNFKAIMKSGMFKPFTFFALDYGTAKRYSLMVGGNKGVVIQSVVYSGSLSPIGMFLSSNEAVYFKNSVYTPKGYKF